MSKKKYYAVKVGKTPGIYMTWADCSEQVTGYKGAKYKSFSTIEEAAAFINDENINMVSEIKSCNIKKEKPPINLKGGYNVQPIRSQAKVKTFKTYIDPQKIMTEYDFIAFVDGSYDRGNQVYGSGVIVLNPDDDSYETYFSAGFDKWDQCAKILSKILAN